MPTFDVFCLRDPLCRYCLGVAQDFVLRFALIQTIDELFRYFHRHLR
jgi:hypothetical protein